MGENMTTIYLIRHSIPSNDKEKYSNEELPLSLLGEEKARLLSNIDELKDIDVLYSSSYKRAFDTAKYISNKNNIDINITDRLNERKLGDSKKYPKSFWLTQLEDEDAKAPDGESRKEVSKRLLSLIDEILVKYKNKRIVLVTHASAITFLLMNFCTLVSANLETKSRHLIYKDKDVINDTIRCPEVFKLLFDEDNNLIDIKLIRKINK